MENYLIDGAVRDALIVVERECIQVAIPKNARIVVLNKCGKNIDTMQLPARLTEQKFVGTDLVLFTDGLDGHAPEFRKSAQETIHLSDLDSNYAIARVLIVEQLYRAWNVYAQHSGHSRGTQHE